MSEGPVLPSGICSALATWPRPAPPCWPGSRRCGANRCRLDEALGRVLAAAGHRRARPAAFRGFRDGWLCRAHRRHAGTLDGDRRIRRRARLCRTLRSRARAVRISTGAALPEGADAVVIQEDVTPRRRSRRSAAGRGRARISVRAGMDFTAGTTLAGKRAAGWTASRWRWRRHPAPRSCRWRAGRAWPSSPAAMNWPSRAPAPGPFQIFDSATYGLAALVAAWGGEAQAPGGGKGRCRRHRARGGRGAGEQRSSGAGRRRLGRRSRSCPPGADAAGPGDDGRAKWRCVPASRPGSAMHAAGPGAGPARQSGLGAGLRPSFPASAAGGDAGPRCRSVALRRARLARRCPPMARANIICAPGCRPMPQGRLTRARF